MRKGSGMSKNDKTKLSKKFSKIFQKSCYKIMKDAGPLLPVGIYVVDSRGQFLYCNEICKHILGIKKRDDVTKLNMVDFYAHPEQRPQLIKKMEDAGGKLSQEIIEFKKLNSKNTIFIEDNCMRYDDFKHVSSSMNSPQACSGSTRTINSL